MNTEITAEDHDTVLSERDMLLALVEGAQKREAEAERTLQLLILAGHVDENRVQQARKLAKS